MATLQAASIASGGGAWVHVHSGRCRALGKLLDENRTYNGSYVTRALASFGPQSDDARRIGPYGLGMFAWDPARSQARSAASSWSSRHIPRLFSRDEVFSATAGRCCRDVPCQRNRRPAPYVTGAHTRARCQLFRLFQAIDITGIFLGILEASSVGNLPRLNGKKAVSPGQHIAVLNPSRLPSLWNQSADHAGSFFLEPGLDKDERFRSCMTRSRTSTPTMGSASAKPARCPI